MARTIDDDRESSPFADAAATIGLCALAVGVFAFEHLGKDISPLHMSAQTFWKKPWQAVTAVLPHANILHILFNVLNCFPLGRRIESHFGSFRTLLFYVMLAAGSMTAEYAFFGIGIGLSGVVYGQWGFLWIASKRSMAFAGAVSTQTNTVFIAWFFFCIAATVTGAMPIANVAHGAGALLGVLTAYVVTTPPNKKPLAIGGLVGTLVLIFISATTLRPWVNFGGGVATELHDRAIELMDSDPPRAVELMHQATSRRPKDPRFWHNRGVVEQHAGDLEAAQRSFEKACSLATGSERARFCSAAAPFPGE